VLLILPRPSTSQRAAPTRPDSMTEPFHSNLRGTRRESPAAEHTSMPAPGAWRIVGDFRKLFISFLCLSPEA